MKKINFDRGNYILYGELDWNNSSFSEQLNDFYIDNLDSLKQLKEKWNLYPTNNFSACGHDYDLRLVRNDTVVWFGEYNYECGWIMTEPYLGYSIDTLQGKLLKSGAKKMKPYSRSYKTLDSMRSAIDSLNSINNIYVLTSPRWLNHAGHIYYFLEFDSDSIPLDSKQLYNDFKENISRLLSKHKFYYEFKYELNRYNNNLYFSLEIWIRDGYTLPKLPYDFKTGIIEINPSEYILEWYERYK